MCHQIVQVVVAADVQLPEPLEEFREVLDGRGLERLGLAVLAHAETFNQVLDHRMRNDCFDRLAAGDLAWIHQNRAVFAVNTATAELENGPDGRVRTGEISPSLAGSNTSSRAACCVVANDTGIYSP